MNPPEVKGRVMAEAPEGCRIDIPGPFCLTIFGASGDLTRRRIIPAVYRLQRLGLLPEGFCVLGAARTGMDDRAFRELMREAVRAAAAEGFTDADWTGFAERLHYMQIDYDVTGTYRRLKRRLPALEKRHATGGNRIFYIATPPAVYETIIENLGRAGLSRSEVGYTHIVVEKPFGHDLESARRLNAGLGRYFEERQIYRMDHYLAKENVQNILIFRFANSIFEPLWNSRYIDHVQITVSETDGVGHRAGYYERAGVLRDMFQNHLLQLLALTAMEPPSVFEAERVRDERVKVFRSIRPLPLERLEEHLVIGQYGRGRINGLDVVGYREEPGVSPESLTPTFAALRLYIDNWRWHGVPFYLRSGKRLSAQKAEISIHFRPVPHLMFAEEMEERIEPNTLMLRVQPDEGIRLVIQTKNPGSRICLTPVLMDFSYRKALMMDAYERVLLDCMQGDQMLFVRADGVEESWALLTPILERLASVRPGVPNYEAGSTGPPEADALLQRDGRAWMPL